MVHGLFKDKFLASRGVYVIALVFAYMSTSESVAWTKTLTLVITLRA